MYKSHTDTSQNASAIPSPDCQAQVPSGCMAQIKVHLEMHWSQWQEMNSFMDFQLALCHLSLNFHSEFRSNSPGVCNRAEKQNLVAIPGWNLKAAPKARGPFCRVSIPGLPGRSHAASPGYQCLTRMRGRVNRAGRWMGSAGGAVPA